MIGNKLQENENIKPNSLEMRKLKECFPQYFNNKGEFDLDKFKEFLNQEEVDISKEGYELKFLGKSYARYLSSLETETFISPDIKHNTKQENKDSENLYIVGDNIDALKHLLSSYAGKIKCIYIDPPYNTGSDGFVYPDNFQFNKEELSKKIGITEEEVQRILELAGRSTHSAWLTFIYPRLILARDLLSDDGVIFISIDDNEQSNLKLICDEIFGESNFISSLKWKRKKQPSFLSRVANIMEYVLVYTKNINEIDKLAVEELSDSNKPVVNASNPISERKIKKGIKVRANVSKIEAGVYKNKTMTTEYLDDVFIENGRTINDFSIRSKFRTTQSELDKFVEQDLVFITTNLGLRRNLTVEETKNKKAITDLLLDWGQNQDATTETKELFELSGDTNIFDNPKPVLLIKNLIKSNYNASDFIILDFFSGSATTAHAVMQLNAEDGGNRKFIMVQIPEETDKKSEAYKAGYKTIDEIGRARIEKAAKKIKDETNADIDYGYKLYYLETPKEKILLELENFNPNTKLFEFDMISVFNNEYSSGKESILATWLNEDGYGLTATSEPYILDSYKADLIEKSLYIINKGLNQQDAMTLIKRIESEELNITRVVIYVHSVEFNILQELRKNLKVLRNNKNVTLIERF